MTAARGGVDTGARERLRMLALVARDAFPGFDWPAARHLSKVSVAYVVGDNDAPHSDPTGAFCDAVSPDVLLALLDDVEALAAGVGLRTVAEDEHPEATT